MKAVFWDLDDTLIDTSGALLRRAIARAAAAMASEGRGLNARQIVNAWEALLGSGDTHSAGDMCRLLARRLVSSVERERVVAAGTVAFEALDLPATVPLTDGAERVLQRIQEMGATQHVITAGPEDTQVAKLTAARIAQYFATTCCVDSTDLGAKKNAMSRLVQELGHQSAKIVCIGDRPDGEIRYGNELGMVTIRLMYGEHLHRQEAPEEAPSWRVSSHAETYTILEGMWKPE